MAHCAPERGLELGIEPDLIRCIFCDQDTNELKLLGCNHSSCMKCLADRRGTTQCTRCNRSTDIPAGGVELEDNFLLKTAAIIRDLLDQKHCYMCKLDGKEERGTSVCFECGAQSLCAACTQKHQMIHVFSAHKPIPSDELMQAMNVAEKLSKLRYDPCPIHLGDHLKHCCSTCQQILCRVCLDEHDPNHKHNTLKDVSRDSRQDIDALLKEAREEIKKLDEQIDTTKQNIQDMEDQRHTLINQIHERVEELVEITKVIGDAYSEKVGEQYDKWIDKRNKNLEKLEFIKTYADDTVLFVDTCLCASTDMEVTIHFNLLYERVEQLLHAMSKQEGVITLPPNEMELKMSEGSGKTEIMKAMGQLRKVLPPCTDLVLA